MFALPVPAPFPTARERRTPTEHVRERAQPRPLTHGAHLPSLLARATRPQSPRQDRALSLAHTVARTHSRTRRTAACGGDAAPRRLCPRVPLAAARVRRACRRA